VLDEGGVPQIAEKEGQNEKVEEENHDIVSKVLSTARSHDSFHF
jgi:hypothetical protein